MKKLVFLFLIFVISAHAQNMRLRDTMIDGKNYKIYPYIIENGTGYNFHDIYKVNIPPVFDSLPDGDYVFLNAVSTKWKRKVVYSPIAKFQIKQNKLTGDAVLYKTDRTQYGVLVDGAKDGLWQEVHMGMIDTVTYSMGERRGLYKMYWQGIDGVSLIYEGFNGDSGYAREYYNLPGYPLFEEHIFRRDSSLNVLKEYYPNGYLALYAESKNVIQGTGYPQFDRDEYCDSVLNYIDGRYIISSKPINDFIYRPFEARLQTCGNAPYTLYHPNGKKMGTFLPFEYGIDSADNKKYLKNNNDTIYYSSGKVAVCNIILPLEDSLEHYVKQRFDTQGRMIAETYYLDGKSYKYVDYDSLQNLIESSYYVPANKRNRKKFSLKEIQEDEEERREIYLVPYDSYHTVERYWNKKSGLHKNFTILKDDSLYAYVDTITQDKVKFIAYYSNGPRSAEIIHLYEKWKISYGFDSLKMYYNNEPFTGIVKFIESKNKGVIQQNEHLVVIDIAHHRWNPERIYIITLNFENGALVKMHKRFTHLHHFTYYIEDSPIRNGVLHGEYLDESGSLFGLIKERTHIFYDAGVVASKEVWKRKKGYFSKFYLVSNEKEVYKKRNGEERTYYKRRKLKTIAHYDNDFLNGQFLEFNVKGDTIKKVDYINGRRDGPYFEKIINADHNGYFVLKGEFAKDKMVNDFTYVDDNNILRVKLHIDTASYVYYFPERIVDWAKITATGSLEIYHPNGNIYSRGKIYYGDKRGTWQYFDEAAKLKYEVRYIDSNIVLGVDTIYTIGVCTTFYENGKTKYIGFLHHEELLHTCGDFKQSVFRCFYNTFVTKEGDTLLNNGTGLLKVYDPIGNLTAEGTMKNGLDNGWWKFYSNTGKLIEAGQYENGYKQGRWLTGDLEGINYLDDKCFANESARIEEENKVMYNIEIEEKIFDKGILIKEIHTTLNAPNNTL